MADQSLYNQPIVIDNGSGNLKAGYAGEEKPKVFSSAIIGKPKYQKIMAGTLSIGRDDTSIIDDTFIGNIAQEYRGLLKLSYPIQHGVVNNWNDMELLWNNLYTHELKASPEEHPLLITEAPLNPKSNRDKMCQVLFEVFNIPCLYVSLQATLSLYASGKTTGVVIDSGDGVTHIVPAYEGFALPTSIKRMDIAGRDLTDQLVYQIRRMSGLNFNSSSEFEVVRDIKEKCCFISKDPTKDEKLYANAHYTHYLTSTINFEDSDLISNYKLPDGHVLRLGPERFRSTEILFNPQLIGDESPGISQLTNLAISKTDLDLRPQLYNSIILSGGNTMLRNFGDRLLADLKAQQNQTMSNSAVSALTWANKNEQFNNYQTKMKIKIFAPPERKCLTWIGGSILAGLSAFKKMWVTNQEYQEDPDVVHKKCI